MKVLLGLAALIAPVIAATVPVLANSTSVKPPPVKCILSSENIPGLDNPSSSPKNQKKICTYSCAGSQTKPTVSVGLTQTCPSTIMH
jgi:hypothetical protein